MHFVYGRQSKAFISMKGANGSRSCPYWLWRRWKEVWCETKSVICNIKWKKIMQSFAAVTSWGRDESWLRIQDEKVDSKYPYDSCNNELCCGPWRQNQSESRMQKTRSVKKEKKDANKMEWLWQRTTETVRGWNMKCKRI